MKKQYLVYYVVIFLLTIVLQLSCQKWIDVKPGSQVVMSEMFKDENGFKEALNGIYIRMGSGLYGDMMVVGVWSSMAQDYSIYDPYHPYYSSSRFDYANTTLRMYINDMWSNMYKAIGELNVILAHIDAQKHVFTGDHYARIKGEALGLRAFLHFDLLRMYGPVPLGNQLVLSIPYVKLFSKEVPPLNTFEQVIQFALTDLLEAESLLAIDKQVLYDSPEWFGGYTRNHFNYWAAKAMMARVYLYAGDKNNALKYAKEVIDGEAFPFVDRAHLTRTQNMDRTFSTEHIFAIYAPKISSYIDRYFRPERTVSYYSSSLFGDSYGIGHKFEMQAGGSTDYRLLYHIQDYNRISYSTKFHQDNLILMQVRNQMPLIRLSEMYYIAAEATADAPISRGYINTVREHRGLAALGATWDDVTKSREIQKEYNKEFFIEGQYLFYLKRLGIYRFPGLSVELSAQNFRFPYPVDEIEFGNR